MTIGEKIVELRKLKGVSQEILANELSVSRQAISKWENGQSRPSTENLKGLAAYFDIELEQLLNLNMNVGIIYNSQTILFELLHDKMNVRVMVFLISLFLITLIPALYLKNIDFDQAVTSLLVIVSGALMFTLTLFIISIVMRYVYKDCIVRGICPWFFLILSINIIGFVLYLLCRDSISVYPIQSKKRERI